MRDRTNRDSYRSARTKKATKACRIPRLPQELHLKVIDLIAVDLNDYGFGHPDLQSTLLSCMLVCHFWLSYARQHLYRNIHINASEQSRDLMRWRACVKHSSSRSISLTVKTVHISFFESTSSLSAFLVFQSLSNLRCLFLHRLDLKKEPISLHKAIAHLVSLYYVDLHHLEECTATELIRFINSFHSLSKLNISFHHNASRLKIGGHLPSLLNPHKLTLESLKIRPIPGISTLLRWMVRTRSFVTRLKKLTIEFKNGKLTESRYQGIDELIGHCGGHLEELILCPHRVTVSEDIHNLVPVSNLSKLRKLCYIGIDENVYALDWAATQLKTIPSPNQLSEVSFHVKASTFGKRWSEIERLLTDGKFGTLARAEVRSISPCRLWRVYKFDVGK